MPPKSKSRLKRPDLLMTLFARVPTAAIAFETEGDGSLYGELVDLIEPVDANFNVVTP